MSGRRDSKPGVSDSQAPPPSHRVSPERSHLLDAWDPQLLPLWSLCSALPSSKDAGRALLPWEVPVTLAVRLAFPGQIWGLKPGQVCSWRRQGPAWRGGAGLWLWAPLEGWRAEAEPLRRKQTHKLWCQSLCWGSAEWTLQISSLSSIFPAIKWKRAYVPCGVDIRDETAGAQRPPWSWPHQDPGVPEVHVRPPWTPRPTPLHLSPLPVSFLFLLLYPLSPSSFFVAEGLCVAREMWLSGW